jgi:anaerobic dimethyl sulfoxide reductase subunit B (iron-sulfur subunit)
MQKDPDNGIVDVDKDVCIGCGSCAAACPYDAPSVDKVTQTSGKCNFCKDLLAKDEMPACVAACSMQAIEYGTLDELKAAHPDAVAQVAPLPDAGQTSPSLLIKPHTKYAADMRFESFNMPEELQASE